VRGSDRERCAVGRDLLVERVVERVVEMADFPVNIRSVAQIVHGWLPAEAGIGFHDRGARSQFSPFLDVDGRADGMQDVPPEIREAVAAFGRVHGRLRRGRYGRGSGGGD